MNGNHRRPVVLLGASNLTIGWRPLLRSLQDRLTGPADLFVAMGMGRSYVDWSRYMARRLPGIVRCGLWDSLARTYPEYPGRKTSPHPPLAMLTDIGNDLVYRRSPEEITEAVEQCILNLKAWHAEIRIVMTSLPMASLNSLSRTRFLIARSVLFPRSDLTLPAVLSDAHRLNELVADVAHRHQIRLVQPEDRWYGLDPIHIRRHLRLSAFRYLFQHWEGSDPQHQKPGAEFPPLPPAAERIVFGRIRETAQPVFSGQQLNIFGF